MNTKNITNYKPKDFAELLGISVKTLGVFQIEHILVDTFAPYHVEKYRIYGPFMAIIKQMFVN